MPSTTRWVVGTWLVISCNCRYFLHRKICSFIKSIGLKSCSEQQQLDAAPTVDRKERNDCTRRDRVTGKKRDTPMEAKLMTLAAIPYKKLLVPLDSDEPWFEQVGK